jgi:hypothetical protein
MHNIIEDEIYPATAKKFYDLRSHKFYSIQTEISAKSSGWSLKNKFPEP